MLDKRAETRRMIPFKTEVSPSAPRHGTPSAAITILPITMHVMNILAPVNAPKLNWYPFAGSLVIALTVADTSAEPLPNASSDTPAKRGGRPILKLNISSDGLKKSSAVEPSIRNNVTSQTSKKGLRMAHHAVVERTELLQKTKEAKSPSPPLQVRAYAHRSAVLGSVAVKMPSHA